MASCLRTFATMAMMYPAGLRHQRVCPVTRRDGPAMETGRHRSIKGPRARRRSLAMETTTVRTAAGTYGGTGMPWEMSIAQLRK